MLFSSTVNCTGDVVSVSLFCTLRVAGSCFGSVHSLAGPCPGSYFCGGGALERRERRAVEGGSPSVSLCGSTVWSAGCMGVRAGGAAPVSATAVSSLSAPA